MEVGEVIAGFGWRMRQTAITRAWWVAALTVGTKDIPALGELLSEEAAKPPTTEEYHQRLRELGLE